MIDKQLTQTQKYNVKFNDNVEVYIKVGTTKSNDDLTNELIDYYVMLTEKEFKLLSELDFNIDKNNYYKVPCYLIDDNILFEDEGIMYVDLSKID